MKKLICLLFAALLIFTCAQAQEIALDGTTTFDLDGDGAPESLTLKKTGFDDDPGYRLTMVAGDGAVYDYDFDVMELRSARIADIDADGMAELLVSGDFYSYDFYTWCFRYDGVDMAALPFDYAGRISEDVDGMPDAGYGELIAAENGVVTLRGSQDILGTWMADRSFKLVDGRFELVEDELWQIAHDPENPETWEYDQLTLVRPLDVTLSDGTKIQLQSGDRFLVTASDKTGIVHFAMQDGRTGSFAVEPDQQMGFGFIINGVPEWEYFEYVPYAD